MKFINREKELEYLEEVKKLSKNKLFTLVIYGLRRVGKTRLILEFIEDKDLYFFVNKNKTSENLLKEYEAILKEKKIITEYEVIKDWEVFFKILFERFKGIVVFDEFQNFNEVSPEVYGILQKNIDLYENRKDLLFIFCGSTIGLIKKLFEDQKQPLYGRIKRKFKLEELSFSDVMKFCEELEIKDFEEIVKLYLLFGGFPKYYVTIEDENLRDKSFDEIIEKLFFVENAPLEDEVQQVLSLELGRRKGIYYDILTAIANGCTTIGEIASFLNKKQTDLTRQVNELVNYFQFLATEKQVIGKKSLFFIRHALMNFWFKFFYKNLSLYKRRDKEFVKKVKEEMNQYLGKRFEYFCREIVGNFFNFTKIGKQWGKIPQHFKPEKGKNTYEIDILALNEQSKEILFGECKWKNNVNTLKICKELVEKAQYVQWHNNERKESFAIFAKSFSKRIKEFEGKKVYCFDLKDLEKVLRGKRNAP